MKKLLLIILSSYLLFSCTDRKKQIEVENQSTFKKDVEVSSFQKSTLHNWEKYYQTEIDSLFSLEHFVYESKSDISKMEGTIYGIFDEQFNPIYTDFLIYSPDRKKYIDIDSYQWSVDKLTNKLMFDVDQEINLVDIPNEKVWRIGFLGPSYWVEDAFWQSDSIVMLLQNSYDQVPFIHKINIETGKQTTFVYKDTLRKKSDYVIQRIQKILKR